MGEIQANSWRIIVSPELLRLSGYLLFGLLLLVCIVLTVAFAEIPEETELKKAFGYNNICVFLDYPPAAWVGPTLWVMFLVPW